MSANAFSIAATEKISAVKSVNNIFLNQFLEASVDVENNGPAVKQTNQLQKSRRELQNLFSGDCVMICALDLLKLYTF